MKKGQESYSEFIGRIYPDSQMIKSVTLQVTEDCNLCCTYCY